jgi:sporulation protein YunB
MAFRFSSYRRRRRGVRVLAALLLVVLLLCALALAVALAQLKPIMNSMATARISNAVHTAVAEAVTETISTGKYDYSDLITLEKDNEGKITALTSNMLQFNRLQIEVAENVIKNVGSVSSSELSIPIGSLTGVALLAGRGPEVHIRILSVGSPETAFENLFTDAGINQTKHQIVLNVTVTVRILMPGYTTSATVDNSVAVAETVIVGSVPETYTYFDSTSEEAKEYIINQ